MDGRALLQELSRQLERDRAAGAVSRNHIWTLRPECADLRREVGGEVHNAREGLARAIETRRLQAEKRLLVA